MKALMSCAFLSVLLLAGCSSKQVQTVLPYSVPVSIEVADDVNQYGDGRPRSVVVRIYQLTEPGPFENAEFLDLYQSDTLLLADSLVDVRYLDPLVPGSELQMNLDVQVQSRYLAVLAEFADYINARATGIAVLSEEPDQYPVYIRLNGRVIDLSVTQPEEKKRWWPWSKE